MKTVYTVFMQEESVPQRGVKFDATIGQIVSGLFLVFIMMVLPIGGYEYINSRIDNSSKEVYTAQAVSQQSSSSTQGRVAGISTTKTTNNSGLKDTFEFALESETLLIIVGVLLITFSVVLTSSLVLDFLKKDE